jgi:hypothetical protein
MKLKLLLLFLIISLNSLAIHTTKFTNSSTIFEYGVANIVYFSDKTQDYFSKPLQHMKYQWNFGDGIFSNEQNPIHLYNSFGIFDVGLSVTDTSINFTSEYYKRLHIQRFRDSCIVIDTVIIQVQDTLFMTFIDTVKITIIDTLMLVGNTEFKKSKTDFVRVYDVTGRFIQYMLKNDLKMLPRGIYIVETQTKKQRLIIY